MHPVKTWRIEEMNIKKSISYSVGSTTTGTMTSLVLSINMNLYTR